MAAVSPTAGRIQSALDGPPRDRDNEGSIMRRMTVLACLTTCPDAATAERIAEALVGEGLAACVNLLPGVTSVYRWQGAVERSAEVLLIIKTTESGFAALRDRLVEIHPYELPELIAVPVGPGLPAYLDWVRDLVARP